MIETGHEAEARHMGDDDQQVSAEGKQGDRRENPVEGVHATFPTFISAPCSCSRSFVISQSAVRSSLPS